MFYNFLILILRNGYKKYGTTAISPRSYFALLVLFILFGIWGLQYGDFLHYEEIIERIYDRTGDNYDIKDMWLSHMEPQYNYLAIFCKGNHILWRSIWQIIEFVGLFYLLSKLKMNNYEALYVFSLFVLQSICGGRVSWGIVYFWLGLYLFLETNEKKYLFFIAVSWFAHTSLILLFVLLPLIWVKPSKRFVIFTVFLMPFFVYLFEYVMVNLNTINSENELLEYKLDSYTNTEYETKSALGGSGMSNIAFLLHKPALYATIVMFIGAYVKNRIYLTESQKRFMALWGAVLVFTIAALFANIGSASYYQRYTMMLYLPTLLLVYKARGDELKNRPLFNRCLFILWLAYNFEYIKAMYYFNVHGV